MPRYDIDFEYKILEFGNTTLEADDLDQADELAREYMYETYPDAMGFEVVSIKEIKG